MGEEQYLRAEPITSTISALFAEVRAPVLAAAAGVASAAF